MTRLRALCAAVAFGVSVALLLPLDTSGIAASRSRSGPVKPPSDLLMLPTDGAYLHTDGGLIRDARGRAVRLSGVNWSGLETCNFAPSGLGQRTWWDVLDQVRALGYNTIRLPYSDQALDPSSRPQGINYTLNPRLQGLSALQVMDRLIAEAGRRGLRIILDRHRPDCGAQSGLWYTQRYPEQRWIANLVSLVLRYRHEPAVIGIDLLNEPHSPATWGDGNPATDWRLAAERAGNAVLRANPNLLIFVEGIGPYQNKASWWGGNLLNAGVAPVRLAVPHRLVYAPHDYGPGLAAQPWFSAPDFPRNLPKMWDHHWGYLQENNIAPVVLGEFGGGRLAPPSPQAHRSVGSAGASAPVAHDRTRADPLWLRALLSYLAEHRAMGFMYWSLMPDSPDVGSLLNDDWQTANITKQVALASLQGAAIPLPGAAPAPAPLRVLASDQVVSANQQNLTIRIVNDSPRPLDLRRAELRYWCGRNAAAPHQQRTADVDYASTGHGTVIPVGGIAHEHGYVAFRFATLSPGAVMMAPYGGVAVLVLRMHLVDWTPYVPRGDWSFSTSVSPTLAPHITLTVAGHLVWGNLPP
jgi:endoglucanase